MKKEFLGIDENVWMNISAAYVDALKTASKMNLEPDKILEVAAKMMLLAQPLLASNITKEN